MADVRLTATNPADSSVVPVACNEKGELLLEEPQVVEGPPGDKGDKGDKGDPGDPFTGNFSGDVTFDGALRLDPPADYHATETVLNIAERGFIGTLGGAHVSIASNGYRNSDGRWTSLNTADQGGAAILNLTASGSLQFYSQTDWPSGSAIYPPIRLVVAGDGEVGVGTYTPASLLDVNGEITLVSRGVSYTIVEQSGLAHLVPVNGTRQGYVDEAGVEHPPVEPAVVERPPLRDLPGEVTMLEEQLQKVMERLKMSPEAGWEVWDGAS